jgi:predicted RNA-binding protein with EMAP domain
MKKQIFFLLIAFSLSQTAHAADSFTSQRDVNAKREAMEAAKIQRETDQVKYSQQSFEELQKSNKLNAEISAKLDKLLESSDANNELMKTLLQRTE